MKSSSPHSLPGVGSREPLEKEGSCLTFGRPFLFVPSKSPSRLSADETACSPLLRVASCPSKTDLVKEASSQILPSCRSQQSGFLKPEEGVSVLADSCTATRSASVSHCDPTLASCGPRREGIVLAICNEKKSLLDDILPVRLNSCISLRSSSSRPPRGEKNILIHALSWSLFDLGVFEGDGAFLWP